MMCDDSGAWRSTNKPTSLLACHKKQKTDTQDIKRRRECHTLITDKKNPLLLLLFFFNSCASACRIWARKYKQTLKSLVSLSLSLSEAPFAAWQQKTDKSDVITGESVERCHDVTNCKQKQWNKSLLVSAQRKVDRAGGHKRGCNFPIDKVGGRVCVVWERKDLVTPGLYLHFNWIADIRIQSWS